MSFENKQIPILALAKECTACLACVDICPKHALSPIMKDDGHTYVILDENKCIGCKTCEKVCVSSRHQNGNNELDNSNIFAAWSLNGTDRNNATSGGVFAAVAKYVIEKGGVVVGASLEGRECKHILITQIDDIKKIQGSKYMASSMAGIYKKIEKEILNRLVLFTGVGCQCAGVLAFFEHNPHKNNLITMDLVCGGSPSHLLLDKFYDRYPNVEKIISFRNKDKYELKVREDGNTKILAEKSLPLHGFNCELTNRWNCYKCQFACAHRKTDITIGDLWNYDYKKEEHSRGISTVIAHTEKGIYFLKNSDMNLNEIRWAQSIKYCKRIVWGKGYIFSPRVNLVNNSRTMSYDSFTKLYCIAMKPSDIKMELFRIFRFIVNKINDYNAKRYINSILRKYEQ